MGDYWKIGVKVNARLNYPHPVYFKAHRTREVAADKPIGRTLYAINLPPYYNEDVMKAIFGQCGKIDNFIFHKEAPDEDGFVGPYRTCHVVFSDETGLQNALAMGAQNKEMRLGQGTENPECVKTGLDVHKKSLPNAEEHYAEPITDMKAEMKAVNKFLNEYEKKRKRDAELAKSASQPDDEGWQVKTAKGRNPGFARKESVANNIEEKIRKKYSEKELKNFYAFQIRKEKMENLQKMRDKYEQDKKKIQDMVAKRKFNPFQ